MNDLISIKNLTKKFGREKAVSDFSIDVGEGEIFAFLGSNGSGKTTTIRCLLGIYQADQGELTINGQEYGPEVASLVGYLPEERGLYTKSPVQELFDYFGELHGMSLPSIRSESKKYMERVGIYEHSKKKLSQLSSGMQQKVQIGVTIMHKPQILILDEPFKGLDPLNRQLFLDIFRELKEAGTTILYSTHVVDEAQRIADRLVMIKHGKRVLYGTVDEVRNQFKEPTVSVEFTGKLPKNDKLYKARIEQKTAELTLLEGVSADSVLKFLVTSEGLVIHEFKVDRPSLNEIFIRMAKTDEN